MATRTAPLSLNWLDEANEHLTSQGYAIIPAVLHPEFIQETKAAMRHTQQQILLEVGQARLSRAGEVGVLRLPMKFSLHFFQFLDLPELLAVVDKTVGETAIMHLQNGFVLPSSPSIKDGPAVFQTQFHQDFPRYMNGYVASINVFFAIDEFTRQNGASWVVPGSHQKVEPPTDEVIQTQAIPLTCPAGSMIVFDSTLWHAAGQNVSGQDRYALNHQFTRAFIKQQIDYVRALGEEIVLQQCPRTQQLLGYYTRVVTSLDEYYQPEEKRLYQRGQG